MPRGDGTGPPWGGGPGSGRGIGRGGRGAGRMGGNQPGAGLAVCHHFGIPALVCINKYDLNRDNTRQIEDYCLNLGVEVDARIPFDNIVTKAIVKGLPVVEYSQGKVSREVESLWQTLTEALSG